MNILLLCDEYPPGRHGGIGTAVQLLARAYVRSGHKVIVAGLYDWGYGQADKYVDEGVEVYRFRFGLAGRWLERKDKLSVRLAYRAMRISGLLQRDIERSLLRYGRELESLIQEHKIDIVEMADFQEYMPYVKRITLFPPLSVPLVVKLHGSVTYFLKESGRTPSTAILASERELLNKANAVCSVSAYTAERTAAYFDYQKPIEVLYNGIESMASGVAKKDEELVIYTGSLVEKKGIYQLMKAWNSVHQQRPAARLHVYGKGAIDKIKSMLEGTASQTVIFKGHVSRQELFRELRRASAAVFPSYAECFALGPMEAMACGAPVIYTLRSSGPELIASGDDGILIDPDNPEEIAESILFLLNHKDAALKMAARGKEKIAKQFDIDYIATQHIAYYQRIISKS